MKKSALALILAVLMAVGLLTIGAAADGTTLPTAVDGVITLTQDVTLSTTQSFDGNVTIDLAGHTITCGITQKKVEVINGTPKNVTSLFWVKPGAKLTIMDSGTNGTVIVNGTNGKTEGFGIYCVYVCGGGEFTLESGTLKNTNSAFEAYEVITNYGTVNINGGSISGITGIFMFNPARGDSKWTGVATTNVNGGEIIGIDCETYQGKPSPSKGWNYGIAVYGPGVFGGTVDNTKSILNITGGTIRAGQAIGTNASSGKYAGYTLNMTGGKVDGTKDGTGMYLPAIGVNNISGGTITGAQGIRICAGELNITDGTIIGTEAYDDDTDLVNGGSGGTAGAIVVGKAGASGYVGSIDVNISGSAKIENRADKGAAIVVSDKNMAADEYEKLGISVDITGGTITGDVRKVSNLSNTATNDGGNTALILDGADVTGNVVNSTKAGDVLIANSKISGEVTNESSSGNMAVISSEITSFKNNVTVIDSTVNGTPTTSGNVEATVNGKLYDDLQDAINAAQDEDTVKLLQNITLDEVVNFEKDITVTVDLNGYNITGENTRVFNVRKGNVTLTGTGTITTVAADTAPIRDDSAVIRVGDNDSTESDVSLTIGAGVTIKAPSTYGVTVFGDNSTETVTVYGTINATGTRAAISGNGTDTTTGTIINIESGAVLYAENYYAVYHPQNGTLNINGGTITGQGGIQMCAGTLNITGKPVVTALNTHQPGTVGGSDGAILDGAAVSLVSRSGYNGGAPDANIKGGTFKTTPGTDAIQVYTWSGGEESAWTEGAPTGFISNGSFSSSVTAYLADNLNYELKSSDGMFSYYETLDAARAAAANDNGAVITGVGSEADVPSYTVTIVYGNGTENFLQTLPERSYNLPAAPSKPGYIFLGWRCGDVTYGAGDSFNLNADMTFYAVWANMPDITPGTPGGDDDDEPVVTFPFNDVSVLDWFYDAVYYVWENELMNGTDVNQFSPNSPLTRAMVWAVLARVDGETISGDGWMTEAQAWAVESGVSDGTDPTGYVTREQLVTMLYRFAGEPAGAADISGYPDAASISDWAADAMAWAVKVGLIEGDDVGALNPTANSTRAHAATFFMRFSEL